MIIPLDRYDEDLASMLKYFRFFWLTNEPKDLSKKEMQELMFSTWCGDNHALYDESYLFFEKFHEAVEEFDKANRKRIFDPKDSTEMPQCEWLNVADYHTEERSTTVDILALADWTRKLNEMYKDAFSMASTTSHGSSFGSVTGSRRISSSAFTVVLPSREGEKTEHPTGFPLRDQKSLKEAMASFLAKVKDFRSHWFYLYGKNYRPITEFYLKRLNEECGFVDTHVKPQDHPNARYVIQKFFLNSVALKRILSYFF